MTKVIDGAALGLDLVVAVLLALVAAARRGGMAQRCLERVTATRMMVVAVEVDDVKDS